MKPAKNKKKFLLILAAVLLIALAAAAGWYLFFRNRAGLSEASKRAQTNQAGENTETQSTDNKPVNGNLQSDPTSSKPAAVPQIPGSVTITSLSANSEGLYIGTLVNGVTSGTCTATLQKSGQTVTDSAPLGLQVSYYLCKGFNPIPRNKFPSAGEWTVQITVKNNQGEVKSDTKKVTIPWWKYLKS